MILKEIDSIKSKVKILEQLSSTASTKQKYLINKELYAIKKGYDGEKQNAFHIDYYFRDSKNYVVLHDIRIVHNDLIFQTDHLVISRLGIFVVESKNYSGTLIINNGNYEVEYKTKTIQIESPIYQNERHKFGLEKIFKDLEILPKRFDVLSDPIIYNKVMISNDTKIKGDIPNEIVRPDQFYNIVTKEDSSLNPLKMISLLSKMLGENEIIEIANKILSMHKPLEIDYIKKYRQKKSDVQDKTKDNPISINKSDNTDINCPKCSSAMVKRKAKNSKYKDKYENSEFYGCSGFPKCRYKLSLEEANNLIL